MSLAVNMGRWQLGTLVLSRRRAMRRLRLANCWRILGFTRNPSGRKRGHGLHNHETPEKAEGFRVFQEPCWAGGENLACVRTRARMRKRRFWNMRPSCHRKLRQPHESWARKEANSVRWHCIVFDPETISRK